MIKSAQISFFQKAKSIPQQSINVAAYRGESHIVQILVLVLALAVAGYLYFVGLSIMNVIMSREATLESERLATSVATLEQEYFTLAKEVGIDAAGNHGLMQPVATSFVKSQNYYAANVTQSDI